MTSESFRLPTLTPEEEALRDSDWAEFEDDPYAAEDADRRAANLAWIETCCARLPARLREFRKRQGQTAAKFAVRIGIKERTLRSYERGEREVNSTILRKMQQTYPTLSIHRLMTDDDFFLCPAQQTRVLKGFIDQFDEREGAERLNDASLFSALDQKLITSSLSPEAGALPTVGQGLRAYRQEKHWSSKQVAAWMGTTQARISIWERAQIAGTDRNPMPAGGLIRLAVLADADLGEVLMCRQTWGTEKALYREIDRMKSVFEHTARLRWVGLADQGGSDGEVPLPDRKLSKDTFKELFVELRKMRPEYGWDWSWGQIDYALFRVAGYAYHDIPAPPDVPPDDPWFREWEREVSRGRGKDLTDDADRAQKRIRKQYSRKMDRLKKKRQAAEKQSTP